MAAMIVALGAGCQQCDGGSAPPAATSAEGEGSERPEGAGARSDERPPGGPAPAGVRVASIPGRYREVGISVEAHGPGSVRLRRALRVERATGDGFERVGAEGLTLRPDCATEAPECVELAPGAELRPPPWTGALGDAQCGCDECRPAPAGRYRFVVTTCDGAHDVASDPFALGD